jgi:hypothetical protein
MTRKELTAMTGSVEQTDYAIEILLKHIRPDFIRSVVKAEAAEIEAELKELEAQGWVWWANGYRNARWSKAEELNGWDLTPEQQAAYDEAYRKCSRVEALLYRLNRVTSLTAVRR